MRRNEFATLEEWQGRLVRDGNSHIRVPARLKNSIVANSDVLAAMLLEEVLAETVGVLQAQEQEVCCSVDLLY
jgi:hypothetical protein